jgi:hypothetical protein
MRKSIIGGLGIGSGMAIFLAVSPPTGGVSAPSLLAWASALAGITALIMLSAFVALRARGIANVIWLAAATAVIYAFVNAVTKSGRPAHVPGSGRAGHIGTVRADGGRHPQWLVRSERLQRGTLALSLPVIDTVEPVCSVILAAAVFPRASGAVTRAAYVPTRRRCDRGGRDCSSQLFSGRAGRSAANPGRPGSPNQRSC